MKSPCVALHISACSPALVASLLLLLFFPALVLSQPTSTELDTEMARLLAGYHLDQVTTADPEVPIDSEDMSLAAIYHSTGTRPLWVTVDGPTEKAKLILEALKESYKDGLEPANYKVDTLLGIWHAENAADLARLDTTLSYSLVRYIHDVSVGQQGPHEMDPDLFAEASPQTFVPSLLVKQALDAPDLMKYLQSLPPQHRHYKDLQMALERYRQLAAAGGWPELPDGESLRPGNRDPRVPVLRKRLRITQDLTTDKKAPESTFYDTDLVKAVKHFQKRHGLDTDGVIGKQTRAALNVSAQKKVDIIRINLARWRWQAHNLGSKYILINIASFNLKAYQGDSVDPVLDFPVIVGEEEHQTPVFSDSIIYLDFNPFWNITPSIAENEELPALQKDASHLVSRHVRLFSNWQADAVELDSTTIDWQSVSKGRMRGYKLRQDPGPWNVLGKIKFVFPNKYSVYMHDTATPNLFRRTQRDFSHGCIRISDPLALAIFVLDGQEGGWVKDKVIELYNKNIRKILRLSSPVPVHITYQTTWVDKDGTINFNSDIYDRDEKLLSALTK